MRIFTVTVGSDIIPIEYKPLDGDAGEFFQEPTPRIEISELESPWMQASAILHEAIHAIDTRMNTHLTEGQVQALEVAIRDLIRQNPQLIDALRESP